MSGDSRSSASTALSGWHCHICQHLCLDDRDMYCPRDGHYPCSICKEYIMPIHSPYATHKPTPIPSSMYGTSFDSGTSKTLSTKPEVEKKPSTSPITPPDPSRSWDRNPRTESGSVSSPRTYKHTSSPQSQDTKLKNASDHEPQTSEFLRRRVEEDTKPSWFARFGKSYKAQYLRYLRQRHPQTGNWFLESKNFQDWLQGAQYHFNGTNNRNIFCCFGESGMGKTILSALVINYLQKNFKNESSIAVAYFFFDSRRCDEQTSIHFVGSLLGQLLEGLPYIQDPIQDTENLASQARRRKIFEDLAKINISSNSNILLPELLQMLLQVVRGPYSRVFFVIDGLDECNTEFWGEVIHCLAQLNADIFITSQDSQDIISFFRGSNVTYFNLELSSEAVENDIEGYITTQLAQFDTDDMELLGKTKWMTTLGKPTFIKEFIVKRVSGTFLLAKLKTARLKQCILKGESLPSWLVLRGQQPSDVYEHIMQEINNQPPYGREIALKILSWTTFAKRPLTILEVQDAIGIETKNSRKLVNFILKRDEVVSLCFGLVTISDEDTIEFEHATIAEYLRVHGSKWKFIEESFVAECCINYLNNHNHLRTAATDSLLWNRLISTPLYFYIARYWGVHARDVDWLVYRRKALRLLKNKAKVSAICQALMAPSIRDNQSQNFPKLISGTHIAAFFNLHRMIKLLEEEISYSDSYGCTPLFWAAKYGSEETVKVLLSMGVVLERKSIEGHTALSIAAELGRDTIVKLLLDAGADYYFKISTKERLTPLDLALRNGHEAVAKVFYGYPPYSEGNQSVRVTHQDAKVSKHRDTVSRVSDWRSVWSATLTQYGQSPLNARPPVSQIACKRMVETMRADSELCDLHFEAYLKLGKERFDKSHDLLLKDLFTALISENQGDSIYFEIIRLLRRRCQREQITKGINEMNSEIERVRPYLAETILKEEEIGNEIHGRFIQSQKYPKSDEPIEKDREATKVGALNTRAKMENADDADDTGINIDVNQNETSDEEIEDRQEIAEDLDSAISFITGGKSFKDFKSNLYAIVHPLNPIHEAIKSRSSGAIERLLTKQFDTVAVDDFEWLTELKEAGYSLGEIADVLLEDANDSPWIYFEPREFEFADKSPSGDFHAPSCVHSSEILQPLNDTSKVLRLDDQNTSFDLEAIQDLCGLGGLIPSSRNIEDKNGNVEFAQENSVAVISYSQAENGDNSALRVLNSNITILKRVCAAFSFMQTAGLCCDAFTVLLRKPHFSENREEIEPVVLNNVEISQIVRLIPNLEAFVLTQIDFAGDIDPESRGLVSLWTTVRHICGNILGPMNAGISATFEGMKIKSSIILHVISLTVQFVTIGFLSYNQAHVGPIQPFFLDTPQHKLVLSGATSSNHNIPCMSLSLMSLTCLGDMIGRPVLVFSMHSSLDDAFIWKDENRFDVISTPYALLDTWGPGHFVVRKQDGTEATASNPQESDEDYKLMVSAIKIRGGLIYSRNGSKDLLNPPRCANSKPPKFHWSSDANLDNISPRRFGASQIIQIGAPVEVNNNCVMDENECWEKSQCAFENLGVQSDHWKLDESQYGGQAGNYMLLQANWTMHKIPGRTWKQEILEKEPQMLRRYLNCLCGLQVSFCTGVSRRVPLRELIADVFLTFLEISGLDPAVRDILMYWYNIPDEFRRDSVQEFLDKLPPDHLEIILVLVQRILLCFKSTGVDSQGKYFSVAWVNSKAEPPIQCLRVPCRERKNSWVHVLADSEDCATFAYISKTCLVTAEAQCQGSTKCWHNTSPLLETEVLQHNENPSKPLGALETTKTYFFQKMDSQLKVVVGRDGQFPGRVALIVAPSLMPAKFKRRLVIGQRNQWIRIREKQRLMMSDDGVERVIVVAKEESTVYSLLVNTSLPPVPSIPPPPSVTKAETSQKFVSSPELPHEVSML